MRLRDRRVSEDSRSRSSSQDQAPGLVRVRLPPGGHDGRRVALEDHGGAGYDLARGQVRAIVVAGRMTHAAEDALSLAEQRVPAVRDGRDPLDTRPLAVRGDALIDDLD